MVVSRLARTLCLSQEGSEDIGLGPNIPDVNDSKLCMSEELLKIWCKEELDGWILKTHIVKTPILHKRLLIKPEWMVEFYIRH